MPDYDGLYDDDDQHYRRRHKYNVHTNLKKYRKNQHWTILLAVTSYDIDLANKLNAGSLRVLLFF